MEPPECDNDCGEDVENEEDKEESTLELSVSLGYQSNPLLYPSWTVSDCLKEFANSIRLLVPLRSSNSSLNELRFQRFPEENLKWSRWMFSEFDPCHSTTFEAKWRSNRIYNFRFESRRTRCQQEDEQNVKEKHGKSRIESRMER